MSATLSVRRSGGLSQKPRLVECGYACQDGIWYKVVKLDGPPQQDQARLVEGKYVCHDGVWYRQIHVQGLDG